MFSPALIQSEQVKNPPKVFSFPLRAGGAQGATCQELGHFSEGKPHKTSKNAFQKPLQEPYHILTLSCFYGEVLTAQAGRWVLHRESPVPPQMCWGCHSPTQDPTAPVTRLDAVCSEKLDHLLGETRAEPSPQDHHVLSHPRRESHGAREGETCGGDGRADLAPSCH